MKKSEFLAQLRSALENNMDAQRVKENVDYYEDYIRSEVAKGESEENVLAHLGDPWAIAKTILMSEKMNGQEYTYRTDVKKEEKRTTENKVTRVAQWKVWLIIAIVIIVLLSLASMALGLISMVVSFAIRYAVPIAVIVLVITLFKKK